MAKAHPSVTTFVPIQLNLFQNCKDMVVEGHKANIFNKVLNNRMKMQWNGLELVVLKLVARGPVNNDRSSIKQGLLLVTGPLTSLRQLVQD